ncbi:MAG: putative metal-binding motif-containing protein [Sandaracinaceae bacterium]
MCGSDCADTNPAIHPGSTEVCNGVDDDCDGWSDSSTPVLVYIDVDRDGHGDATPGAPTRTDCTPPTGYAPLADDCDDSDPLIHAGAPEGCNGADDDCDGRIDEGGPGEGRACTGPTGACAIGARTVCSMGHLLCLPGGVPRAEDCNGADDDCDGFVDEALSRGCADNACGATGGQQRCAGGAWTTCAYGSFPERSCPTDPCGVAPPQRCQSNGMWTDCVYGQASRACANACGAGLETCDPTTGAWSSCQVAPTVVACPGHCEAARLGWTVSLASCAGGVAGACMGFSRSGPASIQWTIPVPRARECNYALDYAPVAGGGFALFATPDRLPSMTAPCAAGEGNTLELEAGSYEACATAYYLDRGAHPRVRAQGPTVGATSTSEVTLTGELCGLGGGCATICTRFDTTGCGAVAIDVVVDSPASLPQCFATQDIYRDECVTVLGHTWCDRVFDRRECVDMGATYAGPGTREMTVRRLP